MLIPTRRSFAFFNLLRWQWKAVLFFGLFATVTWLVHIFGQLDLLLPPLSLTVLGSALSIFISFRTNSAYQRWWEGRQLWGRLVNTSRHFAQQITSYLPPEQAQAQKQLVYRQIAYVHSLRCNLRDQDLFADSALEAYLVHDRQALKAEVNPCQALLAWQFKALTELQKAGQLDSWQMQSLDESLRQLLDIQGGCERIKRTPMPPVYGLLATRLTQIFGMLLPLSLVHDIGWRVIPINVLLCIAFTLVNEVGRVLEDPFNLFYNGLPLFALSRTIEVNLLQRLGVKELPEIPKPTAKVLLM